MARVTQGAHRDLCLIPACGDEPDLPAISRPTGPAAGVTVGDRRVRQQRYQRRNVAERGFDQLKEWRGLASRTDKHALNYRGAITLRATLAWVS